MTSKPLVLVTGVAGNVASHIAILLLKAGYAVRGTVRSGRLDELKAAPIGNNPDFSLVVVDDIATGDLTEALKGVTAIIHTASPLAGREPPMQSLKSGKEGTLNVLRQAVKFGVKKVVMTSSFACTLKPTLEAVYQGVTFTDKDWGDVTEEEFANGEHSPLWVYLAVKILAEKAAWDFAKENPSLDLATIMPPFIFGPPAPSFPPFAKDKLGANRLLSLLIIGEKGRPMPPQYTPYYCDVRDVALAHVRALDVGPTSDPKRFLISGGHFTQKEAAEFLAKTLPEVKDRLPSTADFPPLPGPLSTIDVSRAKNELGISEYISWETSVLDAINAMLVAEPSWK